MRRAITITTVIACLLALTACAHADAWSHRDGQLIGTVSPHGIRPGNAAGTYVVPVPDDAVAPSLEHGRLHLHFVIERAVAAARPASAEEVRNVRAVIIGNDPPR